MSMNHSRPNRASSEPRLEQMNLNLLLALHWLLVERSVTRAAVRLGVTQSAMSRSLGQLREWFDDPLLLPAGRRMLVTARAAGLRDPLTASLDGLRGLLRPPQAFDPATATGTVRMAATEHALGAVVHEFVGRLMRRAPRLDAQIATSSRSSRQAVWSSSSCPRSAACRRSCGPRTFSTSAFAASCARITP